MITFIEYLSTPILISVESNGLKADVFDNKPYLSSSTTQLKVSPDLLDRHYTYETRATLINDVDHREIGCYLIIFDNIYRICGFFHVQNMSDSPNPVNTKCVEVKCANCSITETPVWRFLEIGKVCNACYMYFKKNNYHRPVKKYEGKIRIIRKQRSNKKE
ncbi:hypothetical protein RclHR1_11720006 [Rhizophagus clarus]|uniref:GATA-type domain-containing protein n=1 Tax=Rhizophagus clarus TaxID=94130 RepID=A0A2Z6QK93_9GLOM|nr:hypothetical protein RclHR1_11720006 [Rhizophagus clarus]